MRLDELTPEMLKKAVEIYVRAAYERVHMPLAVKSRAGVFAEHDGTAMDMLSHDIVEKISSNGTSDEVAAYGLRLGNEKYPHMKLLLKHDGESCHFEADPHDEDFELESTDPEALKVHELREHNLKLKEEIETRWREADLPTVEP